MPTETKKKANAAPKAPEAVVAETEKTTTAEPAEAGKTFTEAELNAMIAAAVQKALANVPQATQTVVLAPEETVTVVFFGGIARGTTVRINGDMGYINRDGGSREFPKREFLSKLDKVTEDLLAERKLIIVDGLTDEERERYGVLYTEGELLNEHRFAKLLEYDVDELTSLYKLLCAAHKDIVAKLLITALEGGDTRVTVEKVQALREIDKQNAANENRDRFQRLLSAMTRRAVDGDLTKKTEDNE